jgi:hypothetical protein
MTSLVLVVPLCPEKPWWVKAPCVNHQFSKHLAGNMMLAEQNMSHEAEHDAVSGCGANVPGGESEPGVHADERRHALPIGRRRLVPPASAPAVDVGR